ncbi:MAG: T9SS type A sorting domain-containing protein [Bacteroidales bacterium]|nr:T9SS type A sorting domain-containing protein [Bacteroidales bacterium]MCK4361611.1 T9SS type A sorting domain-containing protein [Bacteroidales bacterium]MCK4408158.1 T9SS type A sorting domain-containing protein [Bacteroidales bacterium]
MLKLHFLINNIINVSCNKEFLLEIYDITGRKLLTSYSTTIDVSQLSKGIYILLIKDKQGVLLEKEKLIVE